MLKKVHEANLKILLEVDRICRKHNIKYLMDSGTLIGAVRHKGFIPWDDDVDIAFVRGDYERFLEVAKDELAEGIELVRPVDIGGGKAFFDFTPKLVYTKSRKHFEDEESNYYDNIPNKVCVDLFVIDKISENAFWRKLHILKMYVIYGMAMGHRYKLDYAKYKGLQKLQVMTLATLGKLFSLKTIYRIEKKAATHYNRKNSSLCYYSNYEPGYGHVIIPLEGVVKTVDYDFEGYKLMGPDNYDGVLKLIYGDYMTPPPEDKRIPKHGECDEAKGFYVEV
ncbi:MAG: LicD family protein [Lachnospiraceae bacterium]|nr:LicD family protein [Lachnospiraceae bacterium]